MLSGTDEERILCDALSHLSSEDIEVFHSVLRGATRYQDSEAQIARKALMVTSRPTSPLTVLKRWSDLKRAVQEDEQTKKNENILGRTLEERFSEALERMKEHICGLFATLAANFSCFIVRGAEKATGKSREVFYYLDVPNIETIISPARMRTASSGEQQKTKARKQRLLRTFPARLSALVKDCYRHNSTVEQTSSQQAR